MVRKCVKDNCMNYELSMKCELTRVKLSYPGSTVFVSRSCLKVLGSNLDPINYIHSAVILNSKMSIEIRLVNKIPVFSKKESTLYIFDFCNK